MVMLSAIPFAGYVIVLTPFFYFIGRYRKDAYAPKIGIVCLVFAIGVSVHLQCKVMNYYETAADMIGNPIYPKTKLLKTFEPSIIDDVSLSYFRGDQIATVSIPREVVKQILIGSSLGDSVGIGPVCLFEPYLNFKTNNGSEGLIRNIGSCCDTTGYIWDASIGSRYLRLSPQGESLLSKVSDSVKLKTMDDSMPLTKAAD